MKVAEVLVDAFGRIREAVHDAVEGLDPAELTDRVDGNSNSVAWLVWHLTRVQDDHIAGVSGTEQLWTSSGWMDRFALPFAAHEIGYGQSSDDVGRVRVESTELLVGYHDAVHDKSVEYLGGLTDSDLDRVVDDRWDPPVTLGVRVVSVIADDLQHAGQAAYVRGLLLARR